MPSKPDGFVSVYRAEQQVARLYAGGWADIDSVCENGAR